MDAWDETNATSEIVRILKAAGLSPIRYNGPGTLQRPCIGFCVEPDENPFAIVANAVADTVMADEQDALVGFFSGAHQHRNVIYAAAYPWPQEAP